MIPLSLSLRNFLSYGSEIQTINFAPYHLICLSGKNGHGKSALLDALTWAIWGVARKVAGSPKADQALIRLGAKNVMVSLDFIANEHTYRIKRECTLTSGKPMTWLDFGIVDTLTDQTTALSGKTIRETQAVIENTIGLSYDTFINSTFLRQGNSNEFSKKTPKERKEVVATILGLDQFEAIKKEASTRSKDFGTQAATLATLIERLDHEAARVEELTELLSTVGAQEADLLQAIEIQRAQLTDFEKQIHSGQQASTILPVQQQQLQILQQQREQALQELRTLRNLRRRARGDNQSDKTRMLQLLNEQQRMQTELDVLANTYQNIQGRRIEREKLLMAEYQQHQTVLLIRQQELDGLVKQMSNEKKRDEQALATIIQQLALLENTCAQLVSRKEQLNKRLEQLRISVQKLEKYRQFYQKMQSYLRTARERQVPGTCAFNDSCPTCGQTINDQQKQALIEKQEREQYRIARRVERLENYLKKIAHQGKLLQEEVALLQEQQAENIKVEAQLQHAQEQYQQLATQKEQLELKIKNIAFSTAEKEFFAIQAAVTAHEQKRAQLQLDSDIQHLTTELNSISSTIAAVQQQLQVINKELSHMPNVEAGLTAEQMVEKIAGILASARESKKVMLQLSTLIVQLQEQLQQLPQVVAFYQTAVVALQDKTQQLAHVGQEKNRLANEKAVVERALQDREQAKKQQRVLLDQAEEYKLVAQALSKDGIQALLIEEALPEIEAEANILLARLSDNNAQIIIESLRDLKSGGVKETLDIKISDNVGVRPYELFSGGEAFRIDFALRIALSKLLARRAGSTLQTLIIDEGFGSQDDDGLLHIMDALYKIQEDFAKIIIVSHLPSMKEQFPVHFMVQKGSQGSQITVSEQG